MVLTQHYFATAPKYTESLLCEELRSLGAENIKTTIGGVAFSGELLIAYKACLWSRIANRILLPLKKGNVSTAEQLYELVYSIAWCDYFSASHTIAVDFHTSTSKIKHSQFGAQKTKDAIVDQFQHQQGIRPSVNKTSADIRINVYLNNNLATISLDFCGHSLHQRGYRTQTVTAPLKENIAAAILMRAKWPDIAQRGGALVDPMCGSGTFLIEAACIAANIAPGLFREDFCLRHWKTHDAPLWEQLRHEAQHQRQQISYDEMPAIIGLDRDEKAIAATKENCSCAELSEWISATTCPIDALQNTHDLASGLIVCNPPYGERLGDIDKLKPLYQRLGTQLKTHFQHWHAAILTSEPDLGKAIGIRAKRINKFYNGNILCQLLHFAITPQYVMRQEHSQNTQPESLDDLSPAAKMFANRLSKNLKHMGKWAAKQKIDCYRVYDADLPEYAFAIDIYQSDKCHVHMQEYAPPKTVNPVKAKQRSRDALRAVPLLLQIDASQVHYKQRQRQSGVRQYQKLDDEKHFMVVQEAGHRFLVNLQDYLDTGLFLDHRITRSMIQQYAKSARFLNLFAYTATASVYAALGGATQTTSVDLSNTYLEWAKKNFRLNDINLRHHRFIHDDCLEWIKKETRQYDLIFLDPPTFSNSKRMNGHFDIQQAHSELIKRCLNLLSKEGLLIFSTNYRKFKLNVAALPPQCVEDISLATIPKDFQRNQAIHRCWRIRKPQTWNANN